jgi:hypothetical protein
MKQLFQFRSLAKRSLLPLIVLTISLATSARPFFPEQPFQSKEVELIGDFNEVEVIGDVTIVLTNNIEGKIIFHGDAKDVQQAKTTIKNKKLVIHAHRKKSKSKFTVFLPAASIELLITVGKTEILSSGTITAQNLEVFLNGPSFVSIRHNGKLKVVPAAGYELDFARK